MLLKEQFEKTSKLIEQIAARRQRKLIMPMPETVIQPCLPTRPEPVDGYPQGIVEKHVEVLALTQAIFKPTEMHMVGTSLSENGRGGRDLTNALLVRDIRCGTVSQLAAYGPIPLRAFVDRGHPPIKRYFDTLDPGLTFCVQLRNIHTEPVLFRGAAFGLTDRNSSDILLIARALRSLAKMVPDTLEVTSPTLTKAQDARTALIGAIAQVNETVEAKTRLVGADAPTDLDVRAQELRVEEIGRSTGMAMAMMEAPREVIGLHMLSLRKSGITEMTENVRGIFERGFYGGYDIAANIAKQMPKEMRDSFMSFSLASAMLPQPPSGPQAVLCGVGTEQTIIAELLGLHEMPRLHSKFLEEFDQRTLVVPMDGPIHIEPRSRVERFVLPQCRFTVHKVTLKASAAPGDPLRYTDGIVVRDIFVGGVSQYVARPGGVHMGAFDDLDVLFDTCEPGQQISIVLENTTDRPVIVEASFTGGPHDMESSETLSSPQPLSPFY